MRRKRQHAQTIFFPWERAGGFWRKGILRIRPFVAALCVLALLVVLAVRERREVGIRSTQATLRVVHAAVDNYRADHERKCPGSLDALKTEGYLRADATDAWGNPLRLVCPGRKDPQGYDLLSDGPDGIIGGLDRVE
jgi:general secretion pathway protein G